MNRTHLITRLCMSVVLSTGTLLAAGCGGDDGAEDRPSATGASATGAQSAGDPNASLGPEISVSGCLTANLDGGSYALTPGAAATSSADQAMQMPGRATITYELVGDAEDFRRYANSVVTARGREDAAVRREADVERKDDADQRPAAGSSDTPNVETKEEVTVNVRRLHVTSVVANGATCPSLGDQARPSTEPAPRPQTQR
jgi:hypothetical protein